MPRRFTVPKATVWQVTDDFTEYLIKWPSTMRKDGKCYRARKRHNPGTITLFTAARRDPVGIVARNRIIDAVQAAIYNAECEARK